MQLITSNCLMFILIFLLVISGCSKSSSKSNQAKTPEDWSATSPSENVVRTPEVAEALQLKLKLEPGDKFPIRKVVEQELLQDSVRGTEKLIKTRLELLFAISVVDRQQERTKLNVRYDRVQYTHHVGAEVLSYDSTRPPANIPVSLRAYHDMVGDGFSFWLGPENQIESVEGFTEFLNRCLRHVPENEKDNVVLGIEAGSGESGIANFIDNSIGLLPYKGISKPGDSWNRPSHIGRPVPMHVNTQYTLQHLNDELATVNIRGEITPSTTMTAEDERKGVRVTVTGGETTGSCTIYRETGLPQQSQVQQKINMTVMVSGALQFNQQKKVTTTIEAFPIRSTEPPTMIQFSETPPRPLDQSTPTGHIRRVSGP